MDQRDGPAGRTSWTDQRNGPAERTSWTDQFSLSLGQFAYLKIDLSVGTLLQLPSPTKALFIGNKVKTGQATVVSLQSGRLGGQLISFQMLEGHPHEHVVW